MPSSTPVVAALVALSFLVAAPLAAAAGSAVVAAGTVSVVRREASGLTCRGNGHAAAVVDLATGSGEVVVHSPCESPVTTFWSVSGGGCSAAPSGRVTCSVSHPEDRITVTVEPDGAFTYSSLASNGRTLVATGKLVRA